jgi:hypothetical protein
MQCASEEIYRTFKIDPALYVVDTYSRMAGPMDPDKSHLAEMAYDKLIAIGREFKCTGLVLDHTGKDPERGVRGSTAKPAASEITMMVKGETGQTGGLVLAIEKNRLGPIPEPMTFNLRSHCYVGDDGLEAKDVIPSFTHSVKSGPARQNKRWQPAREAFWKVIGAGKYVDVQPPKANWAHVRAITWDDWYEAFRREVPIGDKKEDTIKRDFRRGLDDLLGIVGEGKSKRQDSSRQFVQHEEIDGVKRYWWTATVSDSFGQSDNCPD